MNRFSILLLLIFGWVSSHAQGKWGYSVASLKVKSDEKFIDIIFVSKVERLSNLKCKEDFAINVLAEDDQYSMCICDWFYERIGKSNPKVYELLGRNNMIGEVEVYSNFSAPLREKLRDREAATPELPTIYLNKKSAQKKRREFLALAKQINSIVVEID